MDNDLVKAVVAVATAIVGLATLSVIISKSANTTGVIQAATSGLAQDIQAAVSPVTMGGGASAGMVNFGQILPNLNLGNFLG